MYKRKKRIGFGLKKSERRRKLVSVQCREPQGQIIAQLALRFGQYEKSRTTIPFCFVMKWDMFAFIVAD